MTGDSLPIATEVLTSGYVSMDHMVRVKTPVRVGYTSLISNASCNTINYGGCSVNIAYALAQLSVTAAPVLRVGNDWENNGFRDFLEKGNVRTHAIEVIPSEITSLSYMVEDPEGQHICLFYPGSMDACYAHALPEKLFEGVSLAVITVGSRPDNEEFFHQCKTHKVPVAFGMKCDFDAFPQSFLLQLLRGSQVVFSNEGERDYLVDQFALGSIEELFEYEAKVIVTTKGANGSCYAAKLPDGTIEHGNLGCCPVDEIVDATGSGDAYMSGFIYGYLRGYDLKDCCALGATLSAFVLEKEGCCAGVPDEMALLERFTAFRKSMSFDEGNNR